MKKNFVETVLGAVVVIAALGFLMFAYSKAGLITFEGYKIFGKFDRIDGINEGSDVRMSGIKIGTVTHQELDPISYVAILTIRVKENVKLPLDSSIKIVTDGLFGDKYVSITPGADETMLKPGEEIEHTQGSVDLISLFGRMMFGNSIGNKNRTKNGLK